ncbi:unnamed protein product [Notodromas monacha]|uniref:Heparan sulfate 2-O-sulfotransferase 1 n=1 Tax=Notodromas monacha TaxID=399045 RepID=A0A7R9BG89_9CRUS|nr:unnamed protein product [Notodromas monacha]CAG0914908.1 unnamed protein product [Notodromas monacha]
MTAGSWMRTLTRSSFVPILVVLVFSGIVIQQQVFLLRQRVENLEMALGVERAATRSSGSLLNPKPAQAPLVIYNRVPKTGSTSFMGVAYDLCTKNSFHVLHINTTKNSHVLSLPDQARLVHNITEWVEKRPAIYHGHLAYVDFNRFGVADPPIYINIVRRPLDRMVSYYYFLRYGDDFRPHLKRRKKGDKMTFDECVESGLQECDPKNLWLQIPFFCGHAAACWEPGNAWALEQAKHNLVHNYFLVGVTEELEDFVAILEYALPSFFKGAQQQLIDGNKGHLRKTSNKTTPSARTVVAIQSSEVWRMENEFYEFVLENFHAVKRRALVLQSNSDDEADATLTRDRVPEIMAEVGQKFHFEKIRPK